MDSLCAATEHSYQELYSFGISKGGRHEFPCINEHTQIINVNFVIDGHNKLWDKSYKLNMKEDILNDWHKQI